jgi:hypothetical protein
MTMILACPYCNATVTVAPGTPAGGRVSCPRCGDLFTLRETVGPAGDGIQPATALAGVQFAPSQAPPDLAAPRRSNRMVAAWVLGIMGCMAMAGLVFALMTVGERRANDTGLKHKARRGPQQQHPAVEVEPPASFVAPAKLEALGYLPRETGLIAGVHVAELLALPAGKQLLHQPFQIGQLELKIDTFAKWTGLKLEDIDHLVMGMKVDETLPPKLHMVVRSKAAFDFDQLRSRLKGERVDNVAKKAIFRYSAPGRSLPLAMYCPDDHTAVIAMLPSQLESVAAEPVPELEQFSPELREVVQKRGGPMGPLWVAGHVENWMKSPAKRVLEKLKKEDVARLSQVQSFGIFVQLERGVSVQGAFRCKDDLSAKALEDFFRLPRRGSDPALKTALEGPWLTVQMQTDVAAVLKPLGS